MCYRDLPTFPQHIGAEPRARIDVFAVWRRVLCRCASFLRVLYSNSVLAWRSTLSSMPVIKPMRIHGTPHTPANTHTHKNTHTDIFEKRTRIKRCLPQYPSALDELERVYPRPQCTDTPQYIRCSYPRLSMRLSNLKVHICFNTCDIFLHLRFNCACWSNAPHKAIVTQHNRPPKT